MEGLILGLRWEVRVITNVKKEKLETDWYDSTTDRVK